MKNNIGLYIHVPFRIYKHNHRNVLSYFNKDFYTRKYFKYLTRELELRKNEEFIIDSIYIGGGDPSSVDSDFITNLLDYVYLNYDVKPNCEKTIELDPLCPPIRIKRYIEHGVNRFSIKAFTFDKNGLEDLDLNHTGKDTLLLIKTIRKMGIENINLDMFFSYPGQSIKTVKKDIEIINKIQIPHVSFYSAKSDEEVIIDENNIEEIVDESDFLSFISKELSLYGYRRYELNHYSKNGNESYHNKKYWNLESYMGVGLGASGLIDRNLYKNEIEFEKYFSKIDKNNMPIQHQEFLSDVEYEKYFILNKMNMLEGIDLEKFKQKFGHDITDDFKEKIEEFIDNGLIEIKNGKIRFTSKGIYLSNQFYVEII